MWNFATYVSCSKASDDNFAGTFSFVNYFAIQKDSLKRKGDISLPYFTLSHNKKTADFNYFTHFLIPLTPLKLNGYSIWVTHLKPVATTWKHGLVARRLITIVSSRGGGDLYIAEEHLSSVLVFVVPKDSATAEATESSSQPLRVPLPAAESSSQPLSPLAPGSTKLVPFTIEGNKASCDIK